MRFFTTLGLILITFSSFSQTPNISYQKALGGSNGESGKSMVVLPNTDVVVCSSSFSDISGDKTENSFGGSDYWIFQMTASGSIVWQTTIGGSGSDLANAIIQTQDGGFLINGNSGSPISGNKADSNYGGWDSWVVKLSSTGQIEWQKSLGGQDDDFGLALLELPNGNYLIGNSSASGISGTKTVPSKGAADFWIVEMNPSGNVISEHVYGGSDNEIIGGMALLSSNRIVITGGSYSDISGDKNEDSYGSSDSWTVITDLSGTVISSITQGGDNYDNTGSIVIGTDKKITLFGTSSSGISGSKTSPNYGWYNYWVITLDSNLNKIMDASFGGDDTDYSTLQLGVYYNAINQFVMAGESKSDISGNKTLPAFDTDYGDIWVVGLDTNGTKTFEFVAGGTSFEQFGQIIESNNNTLYIVGTSSSGVSGNKTEPSKGLKDIWLFELDFNLSIESVVYESGIDVYPNPVRTVLKFSLPMMVRNSKVILTDVSGKVVFEDDVSRVKESQIDVSSFTSGIYVLSIISNEFQYTRKVVIQ